MADGQLQDALIPPRWGYAGRDGSFAVFVDRYASGPLRLQAIPGRPAPGASVRRIAGSAAAPAAAAVFSPHGVRVIRSVAATAGWTASWHPRHGRAAALAVRRDGLVQAVDVPAGHGVVTWSYRPPGFRLGFALSLGATALIMLAVISALFMSRSRRRRGLAAAARKPRPGRDGGQPGPGPLGPHPVIAPSCSGVGPGTRPAADANNPLRGKSRAHEWLQELHPARKPG